MRHLFVTLLALATLLPIRPAFAQILFPDFGLGARPSSPDNTCDMPHPCLAETGFPETGVYDLDVYGPVEQGASGLRFALSLPEGWTVLSYETCASVVASGDPLEPGSGLELTAEDCWGGIDPILRLTIDCATPGAVMFGPWPDSDRIEKRPCGGGWMEAYVDYGPRVNIGDFCGRLDKDGPCDACAHKIAGTATPPSVHVQIPPGSQETRRVRIVGTTEFYCGDLPECGGGSLPEASCFGGLGDAPGVWIRTTYVGSDDTVHHDYDLTFDATDMLPGTYVGRVEILKGSCGFCEPSCIDVALEVLSPADAPPSRDLDPGVSLGLLTNPVVDRLEYVLSLAQPDYARIDLVDIAGRRIMTMWDGSLEAGRHPFAVSVPDSRLSAGLYFLRVQTGETVLREQVTVVSR